MRLYLRWMPQLGAEAVALYEVLRLLPDVGIDAVAAEELAGLLKSTPVSVEAALAALTEAGFVIEHEGCWLEVREHPPAWRADRPLLPDIKSGASPQERAPLEGSGRDVFEVVRSPAEGVTPEDYFRYMGTLPAPHILEFLNNYCNRDGMSPEVVREALKIASERDARKVGYVRSILEGWVERGVKTLEDVHRFEADRRLRLVAESGKGVVYGTDKQSAARRREGYEWLFGE